MVTIEGLYRHKVFLGLARLFKIEENMNTICDIKYLLCFVNIETGSEYERGTVQYIRLVPIEFPESLN